MPDAIATFHNDPSLRIDFLRQLRVHYEHGQIKQGTNGSFIEGSWHGSNITCALRCFDRLEGRAPRTSSHEDDMDELAHSLGVPAAFVELDSWVFENLRDEELAHGWPLRLYNQLPAGVDMQFYMHVLRDELRRAVPPGLFDLLAKYLWDAGSVSDDDWYRYRHGDGLGIPAAQAVAASMVAAIELHTIKHPPCELESPSRYAQLADEMLRNITRGGMP